MGQAGDEERLVAAVRAGYPDAVRALPAAGGVPLVGPEFEHDHRPTELLRHRWRLEDGSAAAEP
ncbi:hypothetical protein [Streptomyces sp. NPDC012508]|uniref:hypothetical protein n=1 Tax=Streptomyces sp. NPDC012508 TaxID=3364837 RepID=UPI0036B839AD